MSASFAVTFLPNAERDFEQIVDDAVDDASEDSLRNAMSRALNTIRNAAKDCGEPLYDLKHMRMRICRLVVAPLYVEFGVHFNLPSAFIRRVVLLR